MAFKWTAGLRLILQIELPTVDDSRALIDQWRQEPRDRFPGTDKEKEGVQWPPSIDHDQWLQAFARAPVFSLYAYDLQRDRQRAFSMNVEGLRAPPSVASFLVSPHRGYNGRQRVLQQLQQIMKQYQDDHLALDEKYGFDRDDMDERRRRPGQKMKFEEEQHQPQVGMYSSSGKQVVFSGGCNDDDVDMEDADGDMDVDEDSLMIVGDHEDYEYDGMASNLGQ